MKTITIYSIQELEEQFPDAFTKAHKKWQEDMDCEPLPWTDEIMDSLKAVVKAAGLTLKNWSIGPYDGRSFIQVEFNNPEAEQIAGKRAMAWLENNLLGKLRKPHSKDTLRKRRYSHRAGYIPPCPLTGFYADMAMLDHLRKATREGDKLKTAFEKLAEVACELLEQEAEHVASAEYFRNTCENDESLFTDSGQCIAA